MILICGKEVLSPTLSQQMHYMEVTLQFILQPGMGVGSMVSSKRKTRESQHWAGCGYIHIHTFHGSNICPMTVEYETYPANTDCIIQLHHQSQTDKEKNYCPQQ
jgi:hypothetical protein